MIRRDLDAWGVAVMSVLIWLVISVLLGGMGPLRWIIAVILFLGSVIRLRGAPTTDDGSDEHLADGADPARPRKRSRRKPGKEIYGPPE